MSMKEEPKQAKKEKNVHIKVRDRRETTYSDQTGCFSFKSYHSYCYLMIMVDINSSNILVESLKSKGQTDARILLGIDGEA